MCVNYTQLSTTESSVETCSELVKGNDKCKSSHGHFFYGEVTPVHKECACCTGIQTDIKAVDIKENEHFRIYKLMNFNKPVVEEFTEKQMEYATVDQKFKLLHKYKECG